MSEITKCSRCVFYYPRDENEGTCRLYPPSSGNTGFQPPVRSNGGCGQGELRADLRCQKCGKPLPSAGAACEICGVPNGVPAPSPEDVRQADALLDSHLQDRKIHAQEELISGLRKDVIDRNAECGALRDKVKCQEETLNHLEADYRNLQCEKNKEADRLRDDIATLRRTCVDWAEGNAGLQSKLDEKNRTIKNLHDEIERLKTENANRKQDYQGLPAPMMEELSMLRKHIVDLNAECSALKDTVGEKDRTIKNLHDAYQQCRDQNAAQCQEIVRLQTEIEHRKKELPSVLDENAYLAKENAERIKDIVVLNADNGALREKLSRCQKEYQDLAAMHRADCDKGLGQAYQAWREECARYAKDELLRLHRGNEQEGEAKKP